MNTLKHVWIFGPPAVGKMTVGQELAKITGLVLFHNHMVMDLTSHFRNAMKEGESGRLTKMFIEEILTAVAKGDSPGLIYTSVSTFDNKDSWDYSMKLIDIFESRGAETYFVELEADFDVRIERNKSSTKTISESIIQNYRPMKRQEQ
jgi:adenylate kinase family enzyme